MKVSRDYIGKLTQHRTTQSLHEKALIGPKKAVFNFFRWSMGGLTPEPPSPSVRTPLRLKKKRFHFFCNGQRQAQRTRKV